MEVKKCASCGANLEFIRTRNLWVCPFCNSQYEEEAAAEEEKKEENKLGLSEALFSIEKDIESLMEEKRVAENIKELAFCLKNFGTAKEIEDYITRKCHIKDDCAAKGVNEDKFSLIMPRIQSEMEPGESVLLYVNKGIFSQGKEFYAITDKRCIFADKKKCKSVLHTNIGSFKFDESFDTCTWYVNKDYDMQIQTPGSSYKELGAVIALITMLSFEQDKNRETISIV
ncbi:MAG: hypothetical protein J6X66_02015 [Lachnospiraceae bacterium]|nr:hypothetical protein [Lachnospiraceae bacterium]